MFFAQQVAFLVRILVPKCKKSKKVKKPFVLPLQIFGNVYFKCVFCQTLIFKTFLKTAHSSGGRPTTMSLHALCVFLCIPLFDCKMRTLISRASSVREKSIFLNENTITPIKNQHFPNRGL